MTIFVNQKEAESFIFPGGECHIRISPSDIGERTKILANLFSSNDIMILLLTVDAVRRTNPQTFIDLCIPYFPYARQDRVCNEGEALSLKVMTDLINSLKCETITIYDPHSDVLPALLNNCRTISLGKIIAKSPLAKIIKENKLTILSPDSGSEKKIREVSRELLLEGISADVIYARKIRDTTTGDILATAVPGELNDRNFIIIDDICDGGRTFIEFAKEMKHKGARDIYLYVTHGIFSRGLEVLKGSFKHVYCYHTMLSLQQIDSSFLTIIGDDYWY